MITKVSKKLKENNVFHRVKECQIFTRKSIITIPKINEDIVYLVGVIAGDGNLSICKRKRGGNHYKLRISSGSAEYLAYLNDLIYKYFKLRGTIVKDKRRENTFCLQTENTSIFWYFNILESKYNKTNKIPFFCKNKNLFIHYLSGLIDTDGGVSNKRIQLKLKNESIIRQIFYKIKKDANSNPPKINYTNKIPFYYIRFDNIFPLRLKGTNF